MFETVAPEIAAPRSRKLFYESLPASLLAHAAVGALLLVGSTWEVSFPTDSPRQHMMYTLEMVPTPPPAPPASPARPATPEKPVAEQRSIKPEEIVAPTVIPDEIPDVPVMEAVQHSVGEGTSGGAAVAGWTGPVGEGLGDSELGVPGGVEGGVGEQLPPNTVLVKRHQQLPRSMTPMSMVYPFYPEEARMRGWEDAVTVRYTIGRDGRVKSVEVLDPPQRPVFESVVVKAIRHWRFRPLIKDGVAQEVVHELVVYFKLAA
ncbi:MAG: energy transducer TonB [Acidobacteriota bacterium]|nr:energy transducer TonB [Acidobacteriota bacterium]